MLAELGRGLSFAAFMPDPDLYRGEGELGPELVTCARRKATRYLHPVHQVDFLEEDGDWGTMFSSSPKKEFQQCGKYITIFCPAITYLRL